MDERMNEALDQISDRHIAQAARYRRRRPYWLGAVAAILAIVLCIGAFLGSSPIADPADLPTLQGTGPQKIPVPGQIQSPETLGLSNLVAAPSYPKMVPCPDPEDYETYEGYDTALLQWEAGRLEQYDQPSGYADSLTDFFRRSIPEFLSGDGNRAYSPINVYMALAMLAEVTDGSSRQQILDLLGVGSVEALRTQVGHVWNAHYCDDSQTTTLLANSLWLDSAYTFDPDTTLALAHQYYASVFQGDLGTEELDRQLRAWLDSQTGGLLQEHSSQLELPEESVFALASTIYFAAGWESEFSQDETADGIFHCGDHDLRTPFMNKTLSFGTYYRGEGFGAVGLDLQNRNTMWLILPDEGVTVEEVLDSAEYLELIQSPGSWADKSTLKIHLSLPKFDIDSSIDLCDGLKALGVTHVFDPTVSDFSPMVSSDAEVYVDQIQHAVRVAADEEGVVAAAYTVIITEATGAPTPPTDEIHFTLDRPFLFTITSQDQLPLFAGVVEQP